MVLDQFLQDYLRTGHWRGAKQDNPIIKEKGLTYVRHNGIRVGNAQDSTGGLIIFYLWNLQPVGWDRIAGARLVATRHFIEQTAEGRTLISSPQVGDPK